MLSVNDITGGLKQLTFCICLDMYYYLASALSLLLFIPKQINAVARERYRS